MDRDGLATVAKILFQYGPFAIILLLLYKGHSAAQENKKAALSQSDLVERRLAQALYIAVWFAIFACLFFSSYVWYRINVPTTTVFVGELANLGADDNVFFQNREVTWKEGTVAAIKTITWTYVSSAPLKDPLTLEFIVQRTAVASPSGVAPKALLFRLRLDRDALNHDVRVDYDRKNQNLSVKIDGRPEEVVRPVSEGI
jgi:hypothetical protein